MAIVKDYIKSTTQIETDVGGQVFIELASKSFKIVDFQKSQLCQELMDAIVDKYVNSSEPQYQLNDFD